MSFYEFFVFGDRGLRSSQSVIDARKEKTRHERRIWIQPFCLLEMGDRFFVSHQMKEREACLPMSQTIVGPSGQNAHIFNECAFVLFQANQCPSEIDSRGNGTGVDPQCSFKQCGRLGVLLLAM